MGNIAYNEKGAGLMADYQEMYLHLMRETERAVQILIEAQRQCEELYLSGNEPKLTLLPFDPQSE